MHLDALQTIVEKASDQSKRRTAKIACAEKADRNAIVESASPVTMQRAKIEGILQRL